MAEMKLVPITAENWKKAVLLTTDLERSNPLVQQWIMSNAFSLLETLYDPAWDCRLIQAGDQAVGFVFYGCWQEKNRYLLCRYMIDGKYQGRGYGKAALPLVVEQIRNQYGCQDVYLTVEDENTRAVKLYTDFGFQPTGEYDETEQVYVYHG